MFIRGKRLIGVILTILLVFSVSGFTAYYKYTQESGTNFYVGTGDKADALEDTNEVRQILDDLGNLLGHSERNNLYPKDRTNEGTLAIPNSALVSFATGIQGDLFYCSATNVWTKLGIGADNKILVVNVDVPNWETASSDLLSDVASIAMLDENEDITGAWTISTGSIAGVDATEFGYLADITAFGASIIDDADEATFKATVNLEIGTDVLAYQAIGISDNNLIEMDDLDAAVDDYCKLTAYGIVGRSYSEVKTDLGIDLSLYYLKTEMDEFSEIQAIISDKTLINEEDAITLDNDLNMGTHKITGVVDPVNPQEAATKAYADTKVATEVDPNVDSDAEIKAILVDEVTKTGDFTAGRITKINNATGIIEQGTNTDTDVADAVTKKHAQNTDTDLDATFEATFVKKADTVNVLSDITSAGADIEDAVTKKHTSGSETCVGDVSGTVGANTVDKIKGHTVDETAIGDDKILVYKTTGTKFVYEAKPAAGSTTFLGLTDTPANYTDESLKFVRVNEGETALEFAAEADPTVDTDAEIKAILVDEVIKTGVFTAGKIAKINNATGIIEEGTNTDTDVADAVTKKHSQNTDTALGTQTQDLNMGTHKIIGVVNPVEIQDVATKNYVDSNCDLSKDQSPQLADDLDLNDQNIRIDADLDIDHNYSGSIDVEPVGESVVFGDLLYFDWADKEWKKADADAAGTVPGLRVALESKDDGQACLMLVKGYIRDDDWDFTAAMVYASPTTGGVTSFPPATPGQQLQRVGVAKSADILFFDPSIDVGEIKP